VNIDFGGRAHEVLPGLWIGDAGACVLAVPNWNCISVLESPCMVKHCEHHRILGIGACAELPFLSAAADAIDRLWSQRLYTPLLVHCGAGVERSPLTVAWWMGRRFQIDMDRAYAWLKAHRPVVEDRRSWIRKDWTS